MIVSHKYKYVFVQLPHTGSTAISKELRENYDGVRVLRKHAYYHEFLRIASPEERTFFVFSGMRNPLDEAVSNYFKVKTNHKGMYTNPKKWRRNGGIVTDATLRKYNFVQDTDADFPTFFRKFYRIPYNNWSALSHKRFDFIIRFENLQEDFAQVLKLLGIKQKRPLPVVNKTGRKRDDFLLYYTPEIYDQARRVFGPFMKEWGYELPPEWGGSSVPWSSQAQFHILAFLMKLYWTQLKWGAYPHARVFRRLLKLYSDRL